MQRTDTGSPSACSAFGRLGWWDCWQWIPEDQHKGKYRRALTRSLRLAGNEAPTRARPGTGAAATLVAYKLLNKRIAMTLGKLAEREKNKLTSLVGALDTKYGRHPRVMSPRNSVTLVKKLATR